MTNASAIAPSTVFGSCNLTVFQCPIFNPRTIFVAMVTEILEFVICSGESLAEASCNQGGSGLDFCVKIGCNSWVPPSTVFAV